jgi:hypothetical protein
MHYYVLPPPTIPTTNTIPLSCPQNKHPNYTSSLSELQEHAVQLFGCACDNHDEDLALFAVKCGRNGRLNNNNNNINHLFGGGHFVSWNTVLKLAYLHGFHKVIDFVETEVLTDWHKTMLVKDLPPGSGGCADPIHWDQMFVSACEGGHVSLVQRLFEDPVLEPIRSICWTESGLVAACEHQRVGVVQYLIATGPRLIWCRAFWLACETKNRRLIELLLPHFENSSEYLPLPGTGMMFDDRWVCGDILSSLCDNGFKDIADHMVTHMVHNRTLQSLWKTRCGPSSLVLLHKMVERFGPGEWLKPSEVCYLLNHGYNGNHLNVDIRDQLHIQRLTCGLVTNYLNPFVESDIMYVVNPYVPYGFCRSNVEQHQ